MRFTNEDALLVQSLRPRVEADFERLAAEFYDRSREFEQAHAVFTGEAQITRLKLSMQRWLKELFTGPYDEAYWQRRAEVGRVHVRVGLAQRYMFGGLNLLRTRLHEVIALQFPKTADYAPYRCALDRLLDLELAVMLESYNDQFIARIQHIEELERERLSRALRVSEHRYVHAIELTRMLVLGLDASGRICLFNREAEQATGLERDEALGQDFVTLLVPEDLRTEARRRLEEALRPREAHSAPPGDWPLALQTRSGKTRIIRWQLSASAPTPDDDVRLFATGIDTTEEHQLLERTLRSEKLAAVGTLAAGLAHEIRNPLNGALLHLTYLKRSIERTKGDTESLSAVRFVESEILRLSDLVRDFLVFARPAPAHLAPTPMRELCERVLHLLRADAEKAQAHVTGEYPTHDIVAEVDAQKLEQVLLNLLHNALDAVGSQGGGKVVLRLRRTPRTVVLEVEDDGPGLPSADAPIFDAFYSTKPNGTGLGLAIVHRVVTDHDGTIKVDSRPGKTVFQLVLPLH